MKICWNSVPMTVYPTKSSTKYFETRWNDYVIVVELDEWLKRNYKETKYDAWCYAPDGGLIVNGASYKTIKEAVQDCFDNIGSQSQEQESEDDDGVCAGINVDEFIAAETENSKSWYEWMNKNSY